MAYHEQLVDHLDAATKHHVDPLIAEVSAHDAVAPVGATELVAEVMSVSPLALGWCCLATQAGGGQALNPMGLILRALPLLAGMVLGGAARVVLAEVLTGTLPLRVQLLEADPFQPGLGWVPGLSAVAGLFEALHQLP